MVSYRKHIQSERLRTFKLAGHPIRRGDEKDTTAVPALIPIPRGFGVSEVRVTGHGFLVAPDESGGRAVTFRTCFTAAAPQLARLQC